MRLIEFVFWAACCGALYSYAIYPLVLLLPRRTVMAAASSPGEPALVSLIVACRNEQARIAHKLENALKVSYPRLEVLVASDCSDDGSDAITESFAGRGAHP
jgi:cellulose synthase/poly-beta-1,6-N-acetylglucosamine synthase-like glycosyltransferase